MGGDQCVERADGRTLRLEVRTKGAVGEGSSIVEGNDFERSQKQLKFSQVKVSPSAGGNTIA